MASTTAVPNPVPTSRESRRRRKKQTTTTKPHQSAAAKEARAVRNPSVPFSWKSEKAEQIYSSKLIDALRKVSLNNSSSSSSSSSTSSPTTPSPSAAASSSAPPQPPRGRAVREAADRALAVAAKGRTRWSRAILMKNRLKIKFMKTKRPRGLTASSASAPTNAGATGRRPKVGILRLKKGNGKNLPAVQRKVKVLGRLVPGCGKESFPVILEEATDYIEALQMQIRTMTALLNSSVAASAAVGGGGGGGSTEEERTGERPTLGN